MAASARSTALTEPSRKAPAISARGLVRVSDAGMAAAIGCYIVDGEVVCLVTCVI
jgi:hypothetical protein